MSLLFHFAVAAVAAVVVVVTVAAVVVVVAVLLAIVAAAVAVVVVVVVVVFVFVFVVVATFKKQNTRFKTIEWSKLQHPKKQNTRFWSLMAYLLTLTPRDRKGAARPEQKLHPPPTRSAKQASQTTAKGQNATITSYQRSAAAATMTIEG